AAILAGAAISAFGAAQDAAVAARIWARYGAAVEPDATRHAFYGERLAAFQALYQRNAGHFEDVRA
ncbi:MAG: hypothetical protein WAU00_19735, partial [Caldilinea sp.]